MQQKENRNHILSGQGRSSVTACDYHLPSSKALGFVSIGVQEPSLSTRSAIDLLSKWH